MFHLFKMDEDQEATLPGVLLALLLAIPFCLVWLILLTVGGRKHFTSVAGVFSSPEKTEHLAGKLA